MHISTALVLPIIVGSRYVGLFVSFTVCTLGWNTYINTLEINFKVPPILLEKFLGTKTKAIRKCTINHIRIYRLALGGRRRQLETHFKILCGFKPMWRWSDIIIQIVASLESFTILFALEVHSLQGTWYWSTKSSITFGH